MGSVQFNMPNIQFVFTRFVFPIALMPVWFHFLCGTQFTDKMCVSTMAAMDIAYGSARQENHPKNDTPKQSDERARAEGTFIKIAVSQCAGHR